MPTWAQLRTGVYDWTNRPTMQAATDAALKTALRAAHRSGKYWRDSVVQTIDTPVTADGLQVFSLTTLPVGSKLRQAATLTDTARLNRLEPVLLDDLFDYDGLQKTNIFWGVGTNLYIRAAAQQTQYELTYYRQTDLAFKDDGSNSTDWLLADHDDVVILMAAATVLASIGEQEIKSRVDQMLAIALADLQQDNLEMVGR